MKTSSNMFWGDIKDIKRFSENTEENKKKFDFRIISPKTRDKMSVHSVINAYPGGYYLAVQQNLQSMRKKGQS